MLEKTGAKISSSVSKNTYVVVVKDENESTGKVEQAKKLNIIVMDVNKFKSLYFS